jgi:hypothetical protein
VAGPLAGRRGHRLGALTLTATAFLLVSASTARAADFVVTNTNDDGTGSLRGAITAANANSGVLDVVDATGVNGAINLQSALPNLTDNIEIRGPGADQLTVPRDTGGDYRIFTVQAGVVAEISGLTIANGATAGNGGGISNNGTLTLINSTVSGNMANDAGGILNAGTAHIEGTTVAGNLAGDDGGGIQNDHTMTIANTTVTGNTAAPGDRGGGIVNNGDDLLTITNSTIAANTAGSGPNLFQGSTGDPLPVLLTSTILADPLGDPQNCATGGGGEIDSQGFNLDDDGSCDLVEATDQPGADAQLGPLAENGGPTATMMPAQTGDAIDQGISDGLTADQRGLLRPHDFTGIPDAVGGDAADVGAVELQADEFDSDAPETRISKKPKRKLITEKRRVRVKFRFSATDDISPADTLTFECKLDRKPFKSCESPFKKRLKPGKHRFRVFATDEVGNADPTPAKFRFKIRLDA